VDIDTRDEESFFKVEPWQQLEDEAWELVHAGRYEPAAECARAAILRNPNAIDAYVILGRTAATDGERVAFLREGVRLGEIEFRDELALAPRDEFHFWGVVETRPFMRALQHLSLALFRDSRPGAREEAVAIWRRLYRICPRDNLGVRFLIEEYEETGTVELEDDD
jgi:tetratricopeptide (TPR) repeat protein